ncbi:heat shock protein Hsp90 family protein [Tieghemostelium lacteum]|uniref:Heat shock protein Hsp90 family protein n=1 Tax=Tieghemostelium lacteum TaxID=361077 RepID=A0A151ZG14_TIELA|nr:heat shock protein Hsp90 family protein [Tieghemostelium lacteum]|eukprot:KYQ92867.1 heat shock protein Hsp90 family protein [Tieghemostelium lacteum]
MFLQRGFSRLLSKSNNLLLSYNKFNSNVNKLSLLSSNNVNLIKSNNNVKSIIQNNNNNRFYSTKSAAEVDDEIPPEENDKTKTDQLIEETEKVIGLSEKHDFQTETQKILHIVAESLYTEKEVFIRELISNSSDAMEKVKHMQLTSASEIQDPEIPFEVKISTDEDKKTLIIQDSGIGMSREEMIKNLGKIGYSGSKEFLQKLGEQTDKASIIGQFGVGFYSCFMVGHQIKIYTKSAKKGSKGYLWESDGSGSYQISEADGVQRGTKIIIHLKPNAYEYSKKQSVENIIKKYSNFVGFPIYLNGHSVNTIRPLWTMNKNAITAEEHKEFYQFLSKSYDTPTYNIHFSTDSPLSIRSIFYIPSQHMEKYGMGRMEPGVSLFSRRVLIQQKAQGILPDWMRFVRGVVDSEDIPLNVSREHLQDNGLIQRISQVLVKRILKNLDEESKKDPIKFNKFMSEFQGFFKEGIITDFKWKDEISRLLRFESSKSTEDSPCSLDDYVKRMKPDQKQIYFMPATSRNVAETSPYFEPFQLKDVEVIFTYNSLDEFVLTNIGHYGDKKVVSVESKEAEEFLNQNQEKKQDTLSKEQIDGFLSWIQEAVADKLSGASPTQRSISAPAIVVDHESATFRRMMKMMEPNKQHQMAKQQVEFNMNHPIILKLNSTREQNPEVAQLVAEQIIDNALITAGLFDDTREIIPRLNKILDKVLTK